jgi:hypothetical protein
MFRTELAPADLCSIIAFERHTVANWQEADHIERDPKDDMIPKMT